MGRRVLCFGDSNTHGTIAMGHFGERRRHGPEVRWTGVAAAALGPDWELIEEGHPGRTTVFDDPIEGAHKNGLTGLRIALETHRPLDVVLVMLGTNDVKTRFSVGPDDLGRAMDKLAVEIARSEAGPSGGSPELCLVAPVPVVEAGPLAGIFGGAAEKSRGLATVYADVADAHGAAFFDAGTVAEVDPVDGVHLTADAHRAVGTGIADCLRAAFAKQ